MGSPVVPQRDNDTRISPSHSEEENKTVTTIAGTSLVIFISSFTRNPDWDLG